MAVWSFGVLRKKKAGKEEEKKGESQDKISMPNHIGHCHTFRAAYLEPSDDADIGERVGGRWELLVGTTYKKMS